MEYKQLLVDSPVGLVLMQLRALYERGTAPTEELGTLANDRLSERIVTRLCVPGKTFLDVGAHIGSMIVQVARHCSGSRIEAFEPIPEKVDWLRGKFPAIKVHQCALSESIGTTTFYVNLERSAYSSLARNSRQVREIQVSMRTLDSIIESTEVDVVKIDVEGAELGVLLGATSLLARCRPVVMFESGPVEVLGYRKVDLWQFFQERQYGIYVPNRMAHTAPPLTCDCFLDSHAHPRRTTNYFAVPCERFQEVRSRTREILGLPAS